MSSSIGPMAVLYSWLGMSDISLIGQGETEASGRGPVYQAVRLNEYSRLILLTNSPKDQLDNYLSALREHTQESNPALDVQAVRVELSDPTDYALIYRLVRSELEKSYDSSQDIVFHLSPGTPAMSSVWLVLSQSAYPARLIQSSREQGLRQVELPFTLSSRERSSFSRMFQRMMMDENEVRSEFESIITNDPAMLSLLAKAGKAARFNVPVLVFGESGTGKELLCRAIHRASPRGQRAFVAVNCGAIPGELMESEFFGHKKGAFTGAIADRDGYFVQADGGTIFLDEIGELPLDMQVKLLRVLQENEVQPLGASGSVKVNVRILAATNRDLPGEIGAGRFRQDLYYRLAVAILTVPPLRDRSNDIGLLVDRLMGDINTEFRSHDPLWRDREISQEAKDMLSGLSWPGNIRQLINSLKQAALWSGNEIIREQDFSGLPLKALVRRKTQGAQNNMTAGLQEMLDDISREVIAEVLERNEGQLARSARDLGFASHQTLSNWMQRLGIDYTDFK